VKVLGACTVDRKTTVNKRGWEQKWQDCRKALCNTDTGQYSTIGSKKMFEAAWKAEKRLKEKEVQARLFIGSFPATCSLGPRVLPRNLLPRPRHSGHAVRRVPRARSRTAAKKKKKEKKRKKKIRTSRTRRTREKTTEMTCVMMARTCARTVVPPRHFQVPLLMPPEHSFVPVSSSSKFINCRGTPDYDDLKYRPGLVYMHSIDLAEKKAMCYCLEKMWKTVC
jgi:hypothetical protein